MSTIYPFHNFDIDLQNSSLIDFQKYIYYIIVKRKTLFILIEES